MSKFYKMDPSAWDVGTSSLSLEEEAAYLRIVNSINKHDAPVPNIDRVLAGMFRVSTRKARALRDALIEAGKIYVEDDHIWNARARFDVVSRQVHAEKHAEMSAKGGRRSAEVRSKALKNNKAGQPCGSSRIEKNRIEKNPPTPQGGDDGFEKWYAEYPLKRAPDRARKAYTAALKSGATPEQLLSALRRYVAEKEPWRRFAHPATWLNGGDWREKAPDERAKRSPEEILQSKIESAERWMRERPNEMVWSHYDTPEVVRALLSNHSEDRLREAGFTVPGKLVDITAWRKSG